MRLNDPRQEDLRSFTTIPARERCCKQFLNMLTVGVSQATGSRAAPYSRKRFFSSRAGTIGIAPLRLLPTVSSFPPANAPLGARPRAAGRIRTPPAINFGVGGGPLREARLRPCAVNDVGRGFFPGWRGYASRSFPLRALSRSFPRRALTDDSIEKLRALDDGAIRDLYVKDKESWDRIQVGRAMGSFPRVGGAGQTCYSGKYAGKS